MTETKAKHTSETWRADIRKDRIMAYVYGPKHPDGSEYAPLFETTNHAHARLVAAALDLLEAAQIAPAPPPLLEMSKDELLRWGLYYADWWRDLRGTAIARAKGDAK